MDQRTQPKVAAAVHSIGQPTPLIDGYMRGRAGMSFSGGAARA